MASALFNSKVKTFGPRYAKDLGLQPHHVAGLFGNFGVESAEFTARQEIKPTVKGSKGGIGWVQWTGMGTAAKPGRRRQFETFAAAYDLKSEAGYDEACYAFSVWELTHTESAALAALKRTTTVDSATLCVMTKYERPGIPHKERRLALGRAALDVLGGAASKPAKVDIYDGQPHDEVSRVQSLLREKGYFEVGNVDGRWGPRAAGAVGTARMDLGLPDGKIDDAFLVALLKAGQRPVSKARATATAEDLKAAPAVKSGQNLVTAGKTIVGTAIAGVVGKGGFDLSNTNEKILQARTLVETVMNVSPFILVGIAGAVAIWFGKDFIWKEIQGYREGRHV